MKAPLFVGAPRVPSPSQPSSTDAARARRGPWLMLAGIAGMSLALAGWPAPVLSCLLLVGLGADADLMRRAAAFADAGASAITTPLRGLHAALYAVLYTLAWAAMNDAVETTTARWFLTADLALSLLLIHLSGAARRTAK